MGESPQLKYQFIEGLRKGSQLLYLIDEKQILKKKSVYREKVTYVCYKNNSNAK